MKKKLALSLDNLKIFKTTDSILSGYELVASTCPIVNGTPATTAHTVAPDLDPCLATCKSECLEEEGATEQACTQECTQKCKSVCSEGCMSVCEYSPYAIRTFADYEAFVTASQDSSYQSLTIEEIDKASITLCSQSSRNCIDTSSKYCSTFKSLGDIGEFCTSLEKTSPLLADEAKLVYCRYHAPKECACLRGRLVDIDYLIFTTSFEEPIADVCWYIPCNVENTNVLRLSTDVTNSISCPLVCPLCEEINLIAKQNNTDISDNAINTIYCLDNNPCNIQSISSFKYERVYGNKLPAISTSTSLSIIYMSFILSGILILVGIIVYILFRR